LFHERAPDKMDLSGSGSPLSVMDTKYNINVYFTNKYIYYLIPETNIYLIPETNIYLIPETNIYLIPEINIFPILLYIICAKFSIGHGNFIL
jgi:hypothetical protein